MDMISNNNKNHQHTIQQFPTLRTLIEMAVAENDSYTQQQVLQGKRLAREAYNTIIIIPY
jgi:hypothetical protein